MGKDKESKKEKKVKKIKSSSDLAAAFADPANTSTDIILSATPTKVHKSRDSMGGDDAAEEDFYESRLPAQAPFAKPLASKKLNKKVLKTIKKGTFHNIGYDD